MCLLEELDFKTLKVHNDGKDQTKIEFLIQRLKDCVKQKSLLDYFPQVSFRIMLIKDNTDSFDRSS